MMRNGVLTVAALLGTVCCAENGSSQVVPTRAATLANAPNQFVEIGGVRVRYRDAGAGEPVVFLHGLGGRLEDWVGFPDRLRVPHRVIALDLRGFGESAKSIDDGRYGPHLADDVVAVLDALRLPRAHLVGHSLGALVAASAATQYPGRVSSAALIAGPLWADRASASAAVEPWVRDLVSGRGLVSLLAWLLPALPADGPRQMSELLLKDNDASSIAAVLRTVPALVESVHPSSSNVLLVSGARDPLHALSVAFARRYPNASFVQVPEADHITVVSSRETVEAVRQQLDSTTKKKAA